MTPRQGAALALLVLACAFIVSLITGCADRPTQRSYHCRDGSTVSGPAARASSCDPRGGLG